MNIKIVEAQRPTPEEDKNFTFQHPHYKDDFMECDSCRAKPGSPILCDGCLHNREVIGKLRRQNNS